jgi:hypothetical protein
MVLPLRTLHYLAYFADERTKLSAERFFKEEVKLYGLKSAELKARAMAK